jgi:Stress-induced bacterial acidophilic repeat motif
MADSLISRAMREIAKRRMEKLNPEQRQEIARKGGKAWWDKLSEEERRIAIERIQKARKKKRAPIAESNIPLKTQTSRRAKTIKPKA